MSIVWEQVASQTKIESAAVSCLSLNSTMDSAPKRVRVTLGERSYDVLIGYDLLPRVGEHIRSIGLKGRALLVADEVVARIYSGIVRDSLAAAGYSVVTFTFSTGESAKSFSVLESLAEQFANAHVSRGDFVVALGGGVTGDLAGLLAGIYVRGLQLVQIPTTVMAQVDSSVGGKTAINLRAGKNLVGTFYQPRLVVVDPATLSTLGAREFNEGIAEVIKYGIIRDESLLDRLEGSLDQLDSLIERCVQIKAEIVAADEQETTGERALLNFGHTLGHGIEAVAGYGRLLHGEAISLGIRAALWLSVRHADLPPDQLTRVMALLHRYQLPTQLPEDLPIPAILETTKVDKKFTGGEIRFVLTSKLGSAFVTPGLTRADLEAALLFLRT
jgi:3-dehydroquinate synthase